MITRLLELGHDEVDEDVVRLVFVHDLTDASLNPAAYNLKLHALKMSWSECELIKALGEVKRLQQLALFIAELDVLLLISSSEKSHNDRIFVRREVNNYLYRV